VFASGSEGFFQRFGTPYAMAKHELESTRQMLELGLNVPEPLEAFEHEGYGVVVLEYLPNFETLDELDPVAVESYASDLFFALARMHESELVHGDLRAENVLIADGELYFIDVTKVNADGISDARAYDIACALAALEPIIGAGPTVSIATDHCESHVLAAAEGFLEFVNIRPDHSFDTLAIKGEIHKQAE
jgi:tRNA A-37 threonylcarbamoyl transferase component Bud32